MAVFKCAMNIEDVFRNFRRAEIAGRILQTIEFVNFVVATVFYLPQVNTGRSPVVSIEVCGWCNG